MSTATVLVTQAVTPLPVGAAKQANITVTLTDSAGAVQTAALTGAETPPWTAVFLNVAAVAGATGTVVAQAMDISVPSVAIGAPISATFTEIGTPPTFNAPTAITVTIT